MESEHAVRLSVVIETSRHRIRGDVTVRTDGRLSDYANEPARQFFALTDAHIAPLENLQQERAVAFLLVARHEVGLLLPAADHESSHADDAAREEASAHFWALMER